MRGALGAAGVTPEQVDYVNAHGTSTRLNDAAETQAIKAVLGSRAYDVPVSSSKSLFGHMIHAAGSTEAIVCLETMARGWIHPTVNYETPDPVCDLDYVPNVARQKDVRICMTNSLGFGGQNACLVLGRYEGRRP